MVKRKEPEKPWPTVALMSRKAMVDWLEEYKSNAFRRKCSDEFCEHYAMVWRRLAMVDFNASRERWSISPDQEEQGECYDCGQPTYTMKKGSYWCMPCQRRHYE